VTLVLACTLPTPVLRSTLDCSFSKVFSVFFRFVLAFFNIYSTVIIKVGSMAIGDEF